MGWSNQNSDIMGDIRRAMAEKLYSTYPFGSESAARAFSRQHFEPVGRTPPVGMWAGPSVQHQRAINEIENKSRQIFDCRLGPDGVYHPEEVRR